MIAAKNFEISTPERADILVKEEKIKDILILAQMARKNTTAKKASKAAKKEAAAASSSSGAAMPTAKSLEQPQNHQTMSDSGATSAQ